jgi:DNA-binding CsgD family transcriptional regulator
VSAIERAGEEREAGYSIVAGPRPVELVAFSERVYVRYLGVGLWVAFGFTAFAGLSSVVQTDGQFAGVLVCGLFATALGVTARAPVVHSRWLRRCPRVLLLVGAALGSGAWLVGPVNSQLYLPTIVVLGALGIAAPLRVVGTASLIAAAGLSAPELIYGGGNLAAGIVVAAPPAMYWLIIDHIAGFALRLHQSLSLASTAAAVPERFEPQVGQDAHTPTASRVNAAPFGLPQPKWIDTASGTRLTSRQLQVIMLACEGLRHAEIGECLGIGPQQVRRHLSQARERTGAASTPQLVAWALTTGLVPSSTAPGGGDASVKDSAS